MRIEGPRRGGEPRLGEGIRRRLGGGEDGRSPFVGRFRRRRGGVETFPASEATSTFPGDMGTSTGSEGDGDGMGTSAEGGGGVGGRQPAP